MATIKKKAQSGITLSGPTIYGKKAPEYETKQIVRTKRVLNKPFKNMDGVIEQPTNTHEETYKLNSRIPKKQNNSSLASYSKGGKVKKASCAKCGKSVSKGKKK